MKKSLLFGAAALTALSMSAAPVSLPDVLDNLQAVQISNDGKTIVCEWSGTVTVINLETGDRDDYLGEDLDGYTCGQGNAIAEDGTIAGSTVLGPAYLSNGKWTELKIANELYGGYGQGISKDASTIVGIMGLAPMSLDETKTPMQVPAIWTRNEDGTYSDYTILPYPDKDFTGRMPQYVTALCVTDDGSTVIGQIVDYSGSFSYLIVYSKDDKGEWSYRTYDKLVNPAGIEFPEWPGESSLQPYIWDFLSPNEQEAYNADEEAYWAAEDKEGLDYPQMEDYMTDEEKAAYEEAMKKWQEEYDAWLPKYEAFDAAWMECIEQAKGLVMNSVKMSQDGKTIVSNCYELIENPDPFAWDPWMESVTPVIFNITEEDSFYLLENHNINATCITDNGTIFGFTESWTEPRQAWVYPAGEKTPVTLLDFFQQRDEETYNWIMEEMTHGVKMYDWETDTTTVEDMTITGCPLVTPDMSVFACVTENLWDYSVTYNNIYTYIFGGGTVGVKGIAADAKDLSVAALKGGRLMINGDAADVAVYDLNGRMMFRTSATGLIETGLQNGTYIVKVTNNEGIKTLKTTF